MSSHWRHPAPEPTIARYPVIRSYANTLSSHSTSESSSLSASYESSDRSSSVSHLDRSSSDDEEVLQDVSNPHRNTVIKDTRRLVREGETRIFGDLINDMPAPPPMKLNVDQFKVLKQLGQGGNGKVLEVRDRMSGKHLALKVIKKGRDDGLADEFILTEQLAFVRNARNRHTTQLAASFHDSNNFYLLMDIQTGGDVQQLINSMKVLPIELARFYAAELLVGIYGLHARGIMHRDIKPANLLIDEKGHLAISDFGYAKIFEVPEGVHPYGESGPLCQARYVAEERCGTGDFLAPEMLLDAEYSFSVDYWAAGITIFQMLMGHTPWYKARCMEELANCICHAPTPFNAVPRPARTLLFCMLDKNPNRRPRYNQMLTSAFFDGVDWDAVRTGRTRPPQFRPRKKNTSEADAPASLDFSRGEAYSACRDPFPFFTWMSDSMEKERARITAYRLRNSVASGLRWCHSQGRKIARAVARMPKRCSVRAVTRRESRFVIEESDEQVELASHHLPERPQVTTPTLQGREREAALVSQQTGLASTFTEKGSEVGAANDRLRRTLPSPLATPSESDKPKAVAGPSVPSSIGANKTFRKWINRLRRQTSGVVSFEFVSPCDL
ncbi:kinase-like domain-containing protein [Pisolithus thermaeus]|nr:kinase-like domain-containing protein [Pisolithus croceorrhizus]KAI6163312.1 kinase-like domain-containing protein [Pisolithus thermaeus]